MPVQQCGRASAEPSVQEMVKALTDTPVSNKGTSVPRMRSLSDAMKSTSLAPKRFRIEGHTDASGDTNVNRQLSERRAEGVRQFLIANGGAIEFDGNDRPKVMLGANEQAFASVVGSRLRGGGSAAAARKLAEPARVFVSDEIGSL